ncbi:hypothetical protein ACQ7HM_05840 [Williamsia sp. MIQD14]|uniref:hypothetical protein n=1 Tax=Williamsia sp. MIQD14 TaxID=3425703 RepID=UPI003D9FFD1B
MHPTPTENSTRSPTHEHAWLTESAHRTSDGTVLYVRCDDCGTRRIDIATRTDVPPTAVSAPVRD